MKPTVVWCALVFVAKVTARTSSTVSRSVPRSKDPANPSTTGETLDKNVHDDHTHHLTNLGANEIKSLLQDLDQQTTATENADEIGSELLGGRLVKELAIKEEIRQEENENMTDIDSRATRAHSPPPVLKDDSGTPGKTTAKESGVSYLTGQPVWIESQQRQTHSGSENDHMFMFYPITPDNEDGRSS